MLTLSTNSTILSPWLMAPSATYRHIATTQTWRPLVNSIVHQIVRGREFPDRFVGATSPVGRLTLPVDHLWTVAVSTRSELLLQGSFTIFSLACCSVGSSWIERTEKGGVYSGETIGKKILKEERVTLLKRGDNKI